MKALIGILVGLLGIIGSPEILAVLPDYIALILQGIGLVVAGLSNSPLLKKGATNGEAGQPKP